MVSLTDGEKSLRICLAVLTEYRRLADKTDRHLNSIIIIIIIIITSVSETIRKPPLVKD